MGCTDVFADMWKVSDGCDLREESARGFHRPDLTVLINDGM